MAGSINRENRVIEAIIQNNGSLTPALDLSSAGGGLYAIKAFIMPNAWTTANLTFQGSDAYDGTYYDIYDSAGTELNVAASTSRVIVDIPELAAIRFLKIRSGTTGTPVSQGGIRVIKVLVAG